MAQYAFGALDGTPFYESALDMIEKIISCLIKVLDTFKTSIDVMGAGNETADMISAAATTVATILVVIELCAQAMGFHFEDINDAVRFAFKVVVYKIIIENSSKIVSMVYGMFMNSEAWGNIHSALDAVNKRFTYGDESVKGKIKEYYLGFAEDDKSFLGINQIIVSLALVMAAIVVVIICVNIITSIAGLMFELCIDVAIAPVPVATLVNSQTRQIGINFIKGFAGNCLTLTMYTICFSVYGNLVGGISSGFSDLISKTSVFSSIGIIVPEIVGLLLLSVAIKNVGNMINKVLS